MLQSCSGTQWSENPNHETTRPHLYVLTWTLAEAKVTGSLSLQNKVDRFNSQSF